MTPTARTKDACRRLDWVVGVTERWQRRFTPAEFFEDAAHKILCGLVVRNDPNPVPWLAGEMHLAYEDANKRGVRKDLFGFVDVIALCPGECIRYIQCTTLGGVGARIEKILTECRDEALALVKCPGAQLEVWGWRKFKVRKERRVWWAKRTLIRLGESGVFVTQELEDV